MKFKTIIFGPSGAGKGTISKHLVEKYSISYISTGDELRKISKEDSELGTTVRDILDSGSLVPDSVLFDIVYKGIENLDNFILDGFPRTVSQTEFISKMGIDFVLFLNASLKVVKERMLARKRHDDIDEIIDNRLRIYEKETLPVLDVLEDYDIPIYEINANESISHNIKEVEQILSKYCK